MKSKDIWNSILNIQEQMEKLKKQDKINEEQTKQSLILPMFMALGYNIFDPTEFIPEFFADIGDRGGEKVDYAIKLNGQLIMIIEAKKFGLTLGNDQVRQLFRYYGTTDAKVAILTNGNDYWFFTDSKKVNQMDLEPYLKLNVSELTEKDLTLLDGYTKECIQSLDITNEVVLNRFKQVCNSVMNQILTGNLRSDFLVYLIEQAEIDIEVDKAKLASVFMGVVRERLNKDDGGISKQTESLDSTTQKKRMKDFSKKKEIILNYDYNYNEVDWSFHAPEYVLINGDKVKAITIGEAVLAVFDKAMQNDETYDKVLEKINSLPTGIYLCSTLELNTMDTTEVGSYKKINNRDIYIKTAINAKYAVDAMSWVSELVSGPFDIKVSFRR